MTQKEELREKLKNTLLEEDVINALLSVPREEFVLETYKEIAYLNMALPIDHDQTISQPYIVGRMCSLLNLSRDDVVLDIGTGSGYHAAVLSRLCRQVYSLEIIPQLAYSAKVRLKRLGYNNIEVIHTNGKNGYEEMAPYNAINCGAALREVSSAWIDQIVDDGKIIYPKIINHKQILTITHKDTTESYYDIVKFVKFVWD